MMVEDNNKEQWTPDFYLLRNIPPKINYSNPPKESFQKGVGYFLERITP
ncbi:hypothetical protein ACFLRC_03620 [Candidatus Altiarchaeota archaeon]